MLLQARGLKGVVVSTGVLFLLSLHGPTNYVTRKFCKTLRILGAPVARWHAIMRGFVLSCCSAVTIQSRRIAV